MSRVLITLVAVWVFAGGFESLPLDRVCGQSAQRDCKPCRRPDGSMNEMPNVTDVTLDKTDLRIADVPLGQPVPDDFDKSPGMKVNITTTAVDPENDVLTYAYTVSAGRIVGTGAYVVWDLNGVPAGRYTVRAAVDDGCGACGRTMSKAVTITGRLPVTTAPGDVLIPSAPAPATRPVSAQAPASGRPRITTSAPTSTIAASATGKACSCPKISIADPEKSGSDLIFSTSFDGATSDQLSFIWTVIGGKVVSQDKRSIRITPGSTVIGGSVNVIVNGLEPRCSCPNQARKTF